MKTVNVNANIQVPVNASKAQIDEWIKFHLGRANGISGDNPLFDEDDLLAETITVTENTTARVNQAISLALAGVLETVNDSYENGELNIGISTEQLGHPRGDGLAEFLHTEICEATQGEDEQNIPQVAYNSICLAIVKLNLIKDSLSNEPFVTNT